jgi:hypothetical protein
MRPKYRVGKVKSKYLILEIFSYTHAKFDLCDVLWQLSTSLRELIVANFRLLPDLRFAAEHYIDLGKNTLLDPRLILQDLTNTQLRSSLKPFIFDLTNDAE